MLGYIALTPAREISVIRQFYFDYQEYYIAAGMFGNNLVYFLFDQNLQQRITLYMSHSTFVALEFCFYLFKDILLSPLHIQI